MYIDARLDSPVKLPWSAARRSNVSALAWSGDVYVGIAAVLSGHALLIHCSRIGFCFSVSLFRKSKEYVVGGRIVSVLPGSLCLL